MKEKREPFERMAEGERGEGEEGASERRKMGATRYVLGSAILGLFWSSLLKGVLTNSTSRCDYPPCSCDHYGRLTCDCKEEGEVGSTQTDKYSCENRFLIANEKKYRSETCI